MRIATKRTGDASRLDEHVAAARQEAGFDDTDPFDDAMMAAVTGFADAVKAEAAELEAVRGRMVRLARQTSR